MADVPEIDSENAGRETQHAENGDAAKSPEPEQESPVSARSRKEVKKFFHFFPEQFSASISFLLMQIILLKKDLFLRMSVNDV